MITYPKITLLQDRILIKKFQEDILTSSGIILPGTTKQYEQMMGIVVAIGVDFDERINPGDVVYYREDSAIEMEIDGQNYDVVRESSVLMFEDFRAPDPFKAIEIVKELYQELKLYWDNIPEPRKITPLSKKVMAYFEDYPNLTIDPETYKMPFGIYRGKLLKDVPAYYLLIMLEQQKVIGSLKDYLEANKDALVAAATNP